MLMFITAASLIGLGLYGVNDLEKMNDNTRALYTDRVLCMQQLANVRFGYVSEVLPIAQNTKDQIFSFNEAFKRLHNARQIIDTNWRNYLRTYLTPDEARLAKQTDLIKKQTDNVAASLEIILKNNDTTALNTFIQKQRSDTAPPLVINLTRLMELQVQVGKKIFSSNTEIYHRTSKNSFLLIVFSLFVALSLSFYIIKNIKGLIKDILDSNKIIKKSEEKYSSLIDQASDAIYVLDHDNHFTDVNASMCKMLGYTREELLQLNVELIVDPEELKTDPLQKTVNKPGDSVVRERRFITKNGHVFDVEINVKNFANERIMVIARDITDRKRAEELILKQKALSETIINSLPGVFYLQNTTGQYLLWNKNFEIVTGYTKDEIVKLGTTDLIAEEDMDKVNDTIKKLFSDGYATVEAKAKMKDGSQIPFLLSGIPIEYENQLCLLGTGIDISSRIKAEEELRSSEQKYKLLFESNPSALAMIAKDDLSIIAINEAAAKLYGYKKGELLYANASIVRPKEDIELQRENFRMDIAESTDRGAVRHVKKDGTIIFVNVTVSDIMFEGRAVRLVLTTDITEKLIAEEELRKSEQKYKLLFESNPLPLWMVAKDDRSVIAVNDAAADLYGYTRSELLKMSIKELRPTEDLDQQMADYQREINGSIDFGVIRHLKKDGTLFFVQIIAHDIMFDGRAVRLSLTKDVTEQLKAEEELRRSEQQYKLLFESNPLPMSMIAKDDLSIIAVNEAAANLYGYTRDELLTMDAAALRPKEEREGQLAIFGKEASGSDDFGIIKVLRKDGSVIFVHLIAHDIIFEGRPVRLSLINDVTEKLKAEQALKKSEANLQTILGTTDTAYALFDMNLNVLAFNPKAVRFVERQYNHVPQKGDNPASFFRSDRLPVFLKYAGEVLRGKSINYEVDYPQPDGSVFWFDVRLFPIINDNQEILGMMMALYDITERKSAEEDLKNAYNRIQSHINSIKDMAWKQSHLIRSPLANLKGLAEMLTDDPTNGDVLEFIKTELHRMDTIIIEMAEDVSGQDIND